MSAIRQNYKDTLFRKLFGDPENKKDLLSLFNALNGTAYTNEDDLEITTIGDVVYMSMKNDVSCILDCYMGLFEHQSTFNPNMPLRGLLYFGKLYDKYVVENECNLYGSTLIKIPTPRYFVLYNGTAKKPDLLKLKLSDAFIQKDHTGDFEWTATLLNINYGHNAAVMNACSTLKAYSIFVDRVRRYLSLQCPVDVAVADAVDWCIDNNILRSYFIAHKAEVIGVCITEYDEVKTMQAFENEGIKKGIEKERLSAITNLLNKGFSKSVILELGYTEDEFSKVTSNPTQHIDVPAPMEL